MVATLSGRAPLKGLTAAALGLMISMIGSRAQSGTLRWTFDWLYLWDGVPLVPVVLGFSRCRSSLSSPYRVNASPASMPPTSPCQANGKACAMWVGIGGWCFGAACSAPRSGQSQASARR